MLEILSNTFDWNTSAIFSVQECWRTSAYFMITDGVQVSQYEGLEETDQIEKIVSFLRKMEEINDKNWKKLSWNERLEVLQKIENIAALVGTRMPLPVIAMKVGKFPLSANGQMEWSRRRIWINHALLEQEDWSAFADCISTILHEGRHVYQWSNVFVKRTEPSNEKYSAWVMNLQTGYLSYERFGFPRYYMQPVELDARVFAEEICSKIMER